MNKKALTEADIRSKFITPAIVAPGKWDLMTQVREEAYFTKGRVIVRGKTVKRNVFAKYGEKARAVLNALLQKYADSGIASVESLEILKVDPLTAHGTPVEIVKLFGGRDGYLIAIRELETAIYQKAA